MAKPRADSGIMASIMHREHGVEVMPHICCRDKNIIGIRAELLALHMADIRNLLIITGDPVNKEDRQTISGVFDFNSVRLMNYIKQLNSDLLKDDPFIYGGALNYDGVGVQSIIERMKNKMNEGCSYFLTQPIYSNEDIERVKMLRETTGAKVICGIMPLVSYRNALFMKNEVHGINVPDEIMNLYDPEMTREEGESVALSMAVDLAKKLEDIVIDLL
jgi:homocysteine S-methyltransferase